MIQRSTMFRTMAPAALMLGLAMLAGCGWLAAADQRAKGTEMLPEYRGLEDKSVAIVVYPDLAVTNEFPAAREEISNFIEQQFKVHMPKTRLMNSRDVMRWQDETMNWWALSPVDIGKRFNVDRVLYIELRAYEAKNHVSYGDLQGRVDATCSIYEIDQDRGVPAWRNDVQAKWPLDAPLPSWRANEAFVRRQALEQFADKLVKSFYTWRDYGTRIRDRG